MQSIRASETIGITLELPTEHFKRRSIAAGKPPRVATFAAWIVFLAMLWGGGVVLATGIAFVITGKPSRILGTPFILGGIEGLINPWFKEATDFLSRSHRVV